MAYYSGSNAGMGGSPIKIGKAQRYSQPGYSPYSTHTLALQQAMKGPLPYGEYGMPDVRSGGGMETGIPYINQANMGAAEAQAAQDAMAYQGQGGGGNLLPGVLPLGPVPLGGPNALQREEDRRQGANVQAVPRPRWGPSRRVGQSPYGLPGTPFINRYGRREYVGGQPTGRTASRDVMQMGIQPSRRSSTSVESRHRSS